MLRATGISKQFLRVRKGTNIFTAVEQTDFELQDGKFTVITGRSGSGKSTFLSMLSGILTPTTGKVEFGDKSLYELDDKALSKLRGEVFGFIPQGQSAIPSLTVLENVMLPYTLYGEGEDQREYALSLLEQFHILDLKDVMPSELSGGEMRRMAIARALIRKPAVVFADEPTGDLDDENTRLVFELLRKLADEKTSVLMVTHEAEAKQYADYLYHMDAGKLKAEASGSEGK